METFWQDIRFGGRMLLKNKAFTVVAICALAVGIGASTAIFSVVDAVLLRPLPYSKPEKIISFQAINPARGIKKSNVSALDFYDWQKRAEALEHLALFASGGAILASENTEPLRVARAVVTSEFFPALGVQPILGRAFRAEEEKLGAQTVALLGYDLWRRHFGADRNIVGRQVSISGRSVTVVGVMPDGFRFPNADTEIWTSLQLNPAEEPRDNRSLEAIGRLRNDAQTGDVLRLIVRQGMLLALAGAAVGLVASLFLARAIGGLLYDVHAADPAIYGVILLLLTTVALAACYWPARRAAKLNPVVALAQN